MGHTGGAYRLVRKLSQESRLRNSVGSIISCVGSGATMPGLKFYLCHSVAGQLYTVTTFAGPGT